MQENRVVKVSVALILGALFLIVVGTPVFLILVAAK